MPIEYLPYNHFLPPNQTEQVRRQLRKKEVEACMRHLSELNFLKSPFVQGDDAAIRRYKLKNAMVLFLHKAGTLKIQCVKGVHNWLSTRTVGQVALMATTLAILAGIKNLMDVPGYNQWKDPNDLAQHSKNLKDPNEFCHYFVNYPQFIAQRQHLDKASKKMVYESLVEWYASCQKFPISSRILYTIPGSYIVGLSFVVVSAISLVLMGTMAAQLAKASPTCADVDENKEGLWLAKRAVIQITKLAEDFKKFAEEIKLKPKDTEAAEALQRYQAIARQLKTNAAKIERHLSLLEKDQQCEVLTALLSAANVILPRSANEQI